MTPRPSIVGRLSHNRWFGNDKIRRIVVAVLVVLCAIFTLFPEPERAVVTLTPTDPGALGLGDTIGQLGASGNVFGSQAAIDLTVKVGRSVMVRDVISKRLHLEERLHRDRKHVMRWLEDRVKMRALRGGIIQIELYNMDGPFAYSVVNAYPVAIRERLGFIAQQQTAYKRRVLEDVLRSARDRMTRAQDAYDAFRRSSQYAEPQSAVDQVAGRIPSLQQEILAKKRQLETFRQFATDGNPQVRTVVAEIAALEGQLADAKAAGSGEGTLGEVIDQTNQLQRLRRELFFSRDLYYNYRRFYQGTLLENMTATANMRILEPTYLDPARQFNLLPLCLGILILLTGLTVEFYRLRPPVGDEALSA
jgi:hypothetical protein